MVKLTVTSPYTAKDQLKADQATKFIGRGSLRSSTNQYRKDFGVLANTGSYTEDDVVFISAEGNRSGRLKPDWEEIDKAIAAHVTFITDTPVNRNRPYNIGEREVAAYLINNGYIEDGVTGHWFYS